MRLLTFQTQWQTLYKALTSLVGRVEGCSEITQVEGRYLIHDGDVIELDQNDFNSIGKLRLFLLNDSILVARQKDDVKRGKRDAKLKFEALHLLDDVAVVNMRDIGREFSDLFPSLAFF